MTYNTLVREAKDLPEDMIEQAVQFIRFLKYSSENKQIKRSISNGIIFQRSVNPLADDFGGTPEV